MFGNRYEVMTLNPVRMLRYAKEIEKNGHREITFSVNFKKSGYGRDYVLMSTEERTENALIWQILCVLNGGEHKDQKSDFIKEQFLILDFGSFFLNTQGLKDEFNFTEFEKKINKGLKKEVFNDLKENIELGNKDYYNEALTFLFRNGFDLEFDGHTRHFVPFESSASMLRKARVSFVDIEIRDAVNERLMLGMDLKKAGVQILPHKYIGYRGLYLSDASRIRIAFSGDKEDGETGLLFSKETVIVVDDATAVWGEGKVSQITADETEKNGRPYWNIKSAAPEMKIKPFDGEGLICPAYADEISRKYHGEEGASSFHIRMPYIKGMLHCVDFGSFFRDECNIDHSGDEEYFINDAFGQRRDLTKACIILTKSMFKNYEWMEKYCDKCKIKDPMEFFFSGMKKYDHSLYICKTDLNLDNTTKTIKLNYQFLNTLDMDGKAFDSFMAKYICHIRKLEDDPDSQREMILGDRESWDSAWKYAFSRNLSFFGEKYIKKQIRDQIDSRIKGIYKGNIRVAGENRYLSGDLLGLLLHIYGLGKGNKAYDKDRHKALKNLAVKPDEFRMPGPRVKIKPGSSYGFLRNPHLSRNEDCILRYEFTESDIYDKYFSDLTGVIMVAYHSLAPMTLGGADFDGDMVKMIADRKIVTAMRNGRKNCKEVVTIPSAVEEPVNCPDGLSYSHVKDVFGNQIGHISNMAISLGEQVYFGSAKSEVPDKKSKEECHKYCPADCTLLTGLEIDAAKTGKHPKENIVEMEKQINSGSMYISLLKELKMLESPGMYVYKKENRNENGNHVIVYKNQNDNKSKTEKQEVKIPERKEEAPNIEKLPSYYFETMYFRTADEDSGSGNKKGGIKSFRKEEVLVFSSGDKAKTADGERIKEEVSAVIDVYNDLVKRLRYHRNQKKNAKQAWWYEKARAILIRQNIGLPDYSEKLLTLEEFRLAIEHFVLHTDTHPEYGDSPTARADKILEKITGENWIFTEESKRKETLFRIIPADAFRSLPEKHRDAKNLSVLTDFSQKGYMLLYYLIRDIKAHMAQNAGAEAPEIKGGKTVNKSGGHSETYSRMYDRAMETLNIAYENALVNKTPVGAFEKRMRDSIWNFLFGEETIDLYAGAVYDKSESFFWKSFGDEERFDLLKESGIVKDYLPYRNNKKNNRPEVSEGSLCDEDEDHQEEPDQEEYE